MISPQDGYPVRVFDLEREQQADGLDALASSVHVVAHEQVGRLGGEAAVLEQPQHVVVLSVDISADLDGSTDLDEHGLIEEDIPGSAHQPQDVALC